MALQRESGRNRGSASIKAFVRAGLSKGLIPSPCLTLLAILARLWDALRPEANRCIVHCI